MEYSPSGQRIDRNKYPPEPAHLTSEYHKARRQLLLWSGVLFAWELIGIDLTKVVDDGSNIGTIIKSITTPQAIPWVILILIAYFGFRMSIEWYHCDPDRRHMLVSKVDVRVSTGIAVLSYALYFYQLFAETQLAQQAISDDPTFELVIAAVISMLFSTSFLYTTSATTRTRGLRINPQHRSLILVLFSLYGLLLAAYLPFKVYFGLPIGPWASLLLIGGAFGLFSLPIQYSKRPSSPVLHWFFERIPDGNNDKNRDEKEIESA